MRKVTLISLGGIAYQLEEGAHEKIGAYLDSARRALASNPDRNEIMADLEQAIADKCDSFLGKHKNVISADEAAQILREMGPVQGAAPGAEEPVSGVWRSTAGAAADDAKGAESTAGSATGAVPRRKRLMRVPSEGMMGGVCAGVAAYFDVDVVWVRLAFVLLTIFTGVWFFVWLAMLIVMPAARTPEQIASARGEALSAREVMEMTKRKSAELGRAAAAAARDAQDNLRDTFGSRS
jgi:phage shock protein PspC (stress-responsive transcriptional regulator)